jgi:cell division protein FtsB
MTDLPFPLEGGRHVAEGGRHLPPIPRRGERRRRRIDLALTLLAVILLINAVVGDRGLMDTWRARSHYAALAGAIGDLRSENSSLRDEARRLREDPARIEALARRDLGLIRPGEILVVVRTSTSTH